MPRRLIPVGFLLVTLPVAGCGTLANTAWFQEEEGGHRVYGGVRGHCEQIRDEITADPSAERHDGGSRGKDLLFHAIDLPCCVVGDTVMLPINIAQALSWSRSKS